MKRASDVLRNLAARRGIDLDNIADDSGEPVLDPLGWRCEDPVAWRTEQAEAILAYELEGTFMEARADYPPVAGWVQRHLADPQAYPSLTLMGIQGSGKTHQACGVVRELALAAAAANRSYRWRMVTHPELSAELRPKPDESHSYALERYEIADLLVFDDLGAGSLTDFGIEGALHLINHRYKKRLATIYTTNLNDAELKAAFGHRVPSRLYEGTVVVIAGPDRRPGMGEWL
jgi:hypothetical protein